jgi:hypothetical protein
VYGIHPEYIRWQLTKKKVSRAQSRVRRSNVVKLVNTDATISVMNAIAEDDGMQARDPLQKKAWKS